ncbi:hypothetical protein IRZ59_21860 [Pseudomonas guariconensis]|uniref:Rap1a/Tai family immunity protein n=1 Tax=Pseudomonas guariconensis TaxID=1288410 RepID=UPI0018A8A5FB|nr:Rap1a/Tai family immunity protein [Pseudomonas guariconensis]MBF8733079.1 hypothetical protein [Pseudomonas guariconensis]
MSRSKGIVLTLALTASMPCLAYTGNDLQDWARDLEFTQKNNTASWKGSMLVGYVAGVFETLNGVLLCPKKKSTHLQNAFIVSKYLRQNPERWSENGTTLVVEALRTTYPECETP